VVGTFFGGYRKKEFYRKSIRRILFLGGKRFFYESFGGS